MNDSAFTPPAAITLWFCPACGRRITGSYNLDTAKKSCTKTWHRATAVGTRYVASQPNKDGSRLRDAEARA